jgi:hypothetical protein
MAFMVCINWPGVTPEQYEQLREAIGWDVDKPQGGILHVAGFAEDGLRVADVWASPADFQRFSDERLMPALAASGIPAAEPSIEVVPLHALLLQNVEAYA